MQFAERIKRAMRAERYHFDDSAYKKLKGRYQPLLEHGENDIFLVGNRLERDLNVGTLHLERRWHNAMTLDELEEIVLSALEAE